MSPFIHFPQRLTALTVCHLCLLGSSLCEASPSSLPTRGCCTDGESPHHLEQGSSWPPCRPEGSAEQTPGGGPRPCWRLHTQAESASQLPPQSSCPIQRSVRAHAWTLPLVGATVLLVNLVIGNWFLLRAAAAEMRRETCGGQVFWVLVPLG